MIKALTNSGELEARRDDHDAEQAARERPQQAKQRLAEEQSHDHLEQAQKDNARATARPEPVLRRQPTGAMTHGHGAEPAAHEVHSGDAKAKLGNGRGGEVREEVGRERARRDDRVQGRERQLGDPHPYGIVCPSR